MAHQHILGRQSSSTASAQKAEADTGHDHKTPPVGQGSSTFIWRLLEHSVF